MKQASNTENILESINVRPVEPSDGPAVVELLNAVYGNWGDLACWEWKYLQQPVDFVLKSFIATRQDGTAIGFFGANPVDVHFQGTIVRGAQTVDAAVLPQYRRQGIHTILGKCALNAAAAENTILIYAFPGIYSLKVNQQIGYEAVMFTPEMGKVIQPGKSAVLWLRRLPSTLASYWRWRFKRDRRAETIADLADLRAWLLLVLSWISAPTWGCRMPESQQAIQVLDRFWEEFDRFDHENQPRLGLVKNARYLNWRYMQHPRHDYRCLGLFTGEQLKGYCVVRLDQDTAKICELECASGELSTLPILLSDAQTLAQRAGCSALSIWQNSNSKKQAILRKMGFITPFKLHRIFSQRPGLASQLYRVIIYSIHLPQGSRQALNDCINELAISMGDSDLV